MPLGRRIRSTAATVASATGRTIEKRFKSPRVAEVAYRVAHWLAPRRASTLYRLGRVRERRRDWRGAEDAYTAGLALSPPKPGTYLVRRAYVRDRQGRSAEAIADCLAAPDVTPSARLVPKLADALRQEGRLPATIELVTTALERERTPTLLAVLADCYAEMGSLQTACHTYREAVELAPDRLTVCTSYGRTAALRSLVPFDVVDGSPVPVADATRATALDEAVEQFEAVLARSDTRVWAAYWHGRVLESHGQLDAARRVYRKAVERARSVDKPWAHHAAEAWAFREEYVRRRLPGAGDCGDDYRMNRNVLPGAGDTDISDVAGFFEALITNVGLHIEGFVLHGRDGSVEICLDDIPILSVAGNTAAWQRDFKATIVHSVVGEFSKRSRLSLRVGGDPLVSVGGVRSVEVEVPGGSGKLAAMLAEGRLLTKKGRWADTVIRTGEGDDLYFAAYETARRFFDETLRRKLFVSYGTLLGCYRDGRPIAGDDDFDVSYVSDATEPEQLKDDGRQIIRALLRGGFDCRVAMDGRMFHLRVGQVTLDINPFWFHAGRAWSFAAHSLDRDVFEPVRTLDLGGRGVYVPRDPEAFLADNYGADWSVPRPDFQYHRAKADQAVLRRARLVPSEVRELQEWSDELRRSDPSAGRFHGYGDPADARFQSS